MTIDWEAFVTVAVATLVSAVVVVTLFSITVRVHAATVESTGTTRRWLRAGEWALYLVCAATVLFGVYLVIPAFHAG